MFKVLIATALADKEVSARAKEFLGEGFQVDLNPVDTHLLKTILADYDAVIVTISQRVTADVIDASPKLKVIGTESVGTDHIDVEYAESKGIRVVNAAGAGTYSVAEFTFALLLMMVRQIPSNMEAVRKGKWDPLLTVGAELFGKKLGIVGFGRIGSYVAEVARCFGMDVTAYDPLIDEGRFAEHGVARASTLDQLLSSCDFITLHAPLNQQTREMIGKEEIRKIKNGTYLVNTARGDIVDEEAILNALKTGKLLGYAADTLKGEPPTEDSSVLLKAYRQGNVANLYITSHIAGTTSESNRRYSLTVLKNVRNALLSQG